jgi:hypothetical protein
MHQPGLDQGIITFPGVHRRVLRAPAEGFESTSQVMGVILDAELDQNQGADPAERPSSRVKAGLQCSLSQPLQQGLPLATGQAWRTARCWSLPQALKVPLASPKSLRPGADCRATDAQLARDSGVGKVTGLQQPPGLQPAFLKLRTGELSGSPSHGHYCKPS